MRTVLSLMIAAALGAAGVHAQAALAGKWQGETANGASLVLDLAVKGAVVTGTFTRNEQAATIADGKVSKNTFTFKATLGDQTEGFTGELDGDRIRIWLDRQGAANAIVLKRVKT